MRKAFPEDESPIIEECDVDMDAEPIVETSIFKASGANTKDQSDSQTLNESLLQCNLPENFTVIKIKWVHGICEPTLLYLAKR